MSLTIVTYLNAAATTVLAVLTCLYVVATRRMLGQMQIQASAAVEQAQATLHTLRHLLITSMPRWVHAAGEGESAQVTGIRLRNDGNSAAEAIEVSFDPPLLLPLQSTVEGEAAIRPVPPGGHLMVRFMAPSGPSPVWDGKLIVKCVALAGRSYIYELPLRIERDAFKILRRIVREPGQSRYPETEQGD